MMELSFDAIELDEEQKLISNRHGTFIPGTYEAVKAPRFVVDSLPAKVAGAAINRSMMGKRSSLWWWQLLPLPATGIYYYVVKAYGKYIQASLQDDLARLDK
jgi:hypothetical protein